MPLNLVFIGIDFLLPHRKHSINVLGFILIGFPKSTLTVTLPCMSINSFPPIVLITFLLSRLNSRNVSRDRDATYDVSDALKFQTGMAGTHGQQSESGINPEGKADQVRMSVALMYPLVQKFPVLSRIRLPCLPTHMYKITTFQMRRYMIAISPNLSVFDVCGDLILRGWRLADESIPIHMVRCRLRNSSCT
jgi:hypothetical protein